MEDSAVLPLADISRHGDRLAFTTDSYVVDPLFFPGADIGALAVAGTVNDLAVSGATPVVPVVRHGAGGRLAARDTAARRGQHAPMADLAGVTIVTGDTKVVERGAADKLFINTVGHRRRTGRHRRIGRQRAAGRCGHRQRRSWRAWRGDPGRPQPAWRWRRMSKATANRCMDWWRRSCKPVPPRAACATRRAAALPRVLNEFASSSGVGIRIQERALPIREAVRGACEILGLDPLYLANEGKLVAVVPAADADRVLAAMRAHPAGADAAIIGEVTREPVGMVVMQTTFGGERIVDMLVGEQLPRIC